MKKGDYISVILRSRKTVFSFKDIALLWGDAETAARVRINYFSRRGQLYRLRRGFYAKDKDYNRLELASKIFPPSYVSFETVLAQAGIIFQHYDRIFAASYLSRDIVCDRQTYSYRKLKGIVLTNHAGIENKDECSIATKERAFLDTIYINKDYHFDNLSPLDWDKVFEMLAMYGNKRMSKKVAEFHRDFNSGQ